MVGQEINTQHFPLAAEYRALHRRADTRKPKVPDAHWQIASLTQVVEFQQDKEKRKSMPAEFRAWFVRVAPVMQKLKRHGHQHDSELFRVLQHNLHCQLVALARDGDVQAGHTDQATD